MYKSVGGNRDTSPFNKKFHTAAHQALPGGATITNPGFPGYSFGPPKSKPLQPLNSHRVQFSKINIDTKMKLPAIGRSTLM